MNFIDLFSGIGGFRLGMERAGHTCLGHVEIDKFANVSYEAIHGKEDLIGTDITKITDEQWGEFKGRVDVICGGFPCQAFSIAGQQRGFEDTRGTLFFEICRAAKEIEPSYLLLENVKNLLSHNKGETFKTMLRALDDLGYDAEWQVLNSKNFGVPQNRERVFIVGHLRGRSTGQVFFNERESGELPGKQSKIEIVGSTKGKTTTIGARDVVYSEDGIMGTLLASDYKQPKQVLVKSSVKQVGNLIKTDSFGGNPQRGRVYSPEGVSPSLNCCQGGGLEPKIIVDRLGGIYDKNGKQHQAGSVYNVTGLAPTLSTMQGGRQEPLVVIDSKVERLGGMYDKEGKQHQAGSVYSTEGLSPTLSSVHGGTIRPYLLIKNGTKKGYIEGHPGNIVDLEYPESKTRRGRVKKDYTHTIKVAGGDQVGVITHNLKIRKLTPRECWRLQGFPDWAFDKARELNSDTQLYKQAGNSVTVNVIEWIANRLIDPEEA